MSAMLKSVVIILVGDKKEQSISEFLKAQLNLLNLDLKKILVISECDKILCQELNTLSKQYDILIVVGELENNVLFKALGNISCGDLKVNHLLRLKSKNDELAMLPLAAKLLTNKKLPFPVIYLQRIFILKKQFTEIQFLTALRSHLEQYTSQRIFKVIIQMQMNGNSKTILDQLRNFVHAQIQNTDVIEGISNLIITSPDFESITECLNILKYKWKESFIDFSESTDLFTRMYEMTDEHIINSLKIIEDAFIRYGPDSIFLSFNGGKDCTVLLYLVYMILKTKYPNYKKPIFCLYIKNKNAFPEQDNFIRQCQIFYNLDILVVTSSIKDALNNVLKSKPHLKAVFMGTRRTDPYSQHLKAFQMTDPDWPQVMRINPILDWHYSDIWDYLLFYKVPYCKLYDLGYTSLGSSSNTVKNPSLIYYDIHQDKNVYLPAYKLFKESEERSGRNVGM